MRNLSPHITPRWDSDCEKERRDWAKKKISMICISIEGTNCTNIYQARSLTGLLKRHSCTPVTLLHNGKLAKITVFHCNELVALHIKRAQSLRCTAKGLQGRAVWMGSFSCSLTLALHSTIISPTHQRALTHVYSCLSLSLSRSLALSFSVSHSSSSADAILKVDKSGESLRTKREPPQWARPVRETSMLTTSAGRKHGCALVREARARRRKQGNSDPTHRSFNRTPD